MVRPSASYEMSRVVTMGARYSRPADAILAPMHGDPGRRLQVGLAAGLGALAAALLASCSSGPASPSATPTTRPHGAPPASSSSTSTTAPPTTLPAAAASGPLQVSSPIALPFSADRVTAAESPDGAVFAAPQDPTSPSPAIAWVVDGNGPALVAEHVATGIAALAADATNFYVATYADVFAYNRASGNQDAQWKMPTVHAANSSDADLVSLAAAGGGVLVSVTQGTTVSVYRIDPASSAGPRLLVRGLGDAIGTDGSVYYERGDHRLAVRHPDGTATTGSVLAHTPNGLGGGVQYVDAVAGGALWVSEPAGQGLDAGFTTYDASTLGALGSYSGSVSSSVVDSAAGPLTLEPAGTTASCPAGAPASPTSCVLRIDQHGAVSDAVGVGAAVSLLGPDPAVVVSDTSTGQFDLLRLS
jgi:hypothetical protein